MGGRGYGRFQVCPFVVEESERERQKRGVCQGRWAIVFSIE